MDNMIWYIYILVSLVYTSCDEYSIMWICVYMYAYICACVHMCAMPIVHVYVYARVCVRMCDMSLSTHGFPLSLNLWSLIRHFTFHLLHFLLSVPPLPLPPLQCLPSLRSFNFISWKSTENYSIYQPLSI